MNYLAVMVNARIYVVIRECLYVTVVCVLQN